MWDKIKSQFKGDRYIWWIVILLSVMSLLAVYSSIGSLAYRNRQGNTESTFVGHFVFILVGFFMTVIIHKIDLSKGVYLRIARILLFLSPVLLFLTLNLGSEVGGAKRSLGILGLAGSPAEFIKVILIVNLAALLAGKIHKEYNAKDIGEIIFWCAIIIFLTTFSDFASAAILGMTCFIVMWIGKVPNRYLYKLILAIGVVIILAFSIGFGFEKITGKQIGRFKTVVERTESFLGKDLNKDGIVGIPLSNQTQLAQAAIAHGSFFGVGPGNSSQKNVLPEAYSDFIYSIIVEEYGLVGGVIVMLLYLGLLGRGIINIKKTERAFGGLLLIGLTLMLSLQAFIHIAVNVGLAPNTGITLPLISKGGSSALSSFVALGIVLGVSNQTEK